MNIFIEHLVQLQALEMGPSPGSPEKVKSIQELRRKIPQPVIAHYDRLRAREKKGVALVRNGVCTECHMCLASGTRGQVLRGEDVMLCDNCGRYLYVANEPVAGEDSPSAPPPPTPRKRRKKATATASTEKPS